MLLNIKSNKKIYQPYLIIFASGNYKAEKRMKCGKKPLYKNMKVFTLHMILTLRQKAFLLMPTKWYS